MDAVYDPMTANIKVFSLILIPIIFLLQGVNPHLS